MCGRVTVKSSPQELAEAAGAVAIIAAPERPDYNLPPTRELPVVANTGARELDLFRWGLVPSWAKDTKGPLLNNARAETLAEKRTFKTLLQSRRCLVVADGFYEWLRVGEGKSAKKTPFYIRRKDGKPMVFAGLWDQREDAQAHVLRSCTIITTGPNAVLRPIHDRMPVILAREAFELWLSPEKLPPERLTPLLVPCPDALLEVVQVSPLVNSVKHNSPDCIAPVGAEPARQ